MELNKTELNKTELNRRNDLKMNRFFQNPQFLQCLGTAGATPISCYSAKSTERDRMG